MRLSRLSAMGAWCAAALSVCAAGTKEPHETETDPSAAPTVEAEQVRSDALPEGMRVHGTGYLSFNAPVDDGTPCSLNLFLAQVELRYGRGPWVLYATPRLKLSPVGGSNADATLFLQQAYGSYRHPLGEVKVGKVYTRLGRLWDYGFYGPLLANNDEKLTPELGLSAEGAPPLTPDIDLEYALQFFAVDGRALALRAQRWFAAAHVHRQNILVARVAPIYRFAALGQVQVGLSGERYDAVFAGPKHQVVRASLDADVDWGPMSAFAEVGRQSGHDFSTTTHEDVPSHSYVWTGITFRQSWFNLRYHLNVISYDGQPADVETLHQPGAEFAVNEYLSLIGEAAVWTTSQPTLPYRERSFYLIANGKF